MGTNSTYLKRVLLTSVIGVSAAIGLCTNNLAIAKSDTSAATPAELAASVLASENPQSVPGASILTREDNEFLNDLEKRGISFFINEADPTTGLMPDRARANGGQPSVSSIASVGFGLSALCVGESRGWISHDEAYQRVLRVLQFLSSEKVDRVHGFYYHFINLSDGHREWNCELSSIDTALLMTGILTVQSYFPDSEVDRLASQIFDAVDWPWFQNGRSTLCMGWTPEKGFMSAQWDGFCEGPMIYLLAMGSKTHPLPSSSWNAWKRTPVITYAGLHYMLCPPLFTHQYPQCWYDQRGLRDDYADYFHDSALATIAQRQWSIDELSKKFPTYGPNMWGATASDSPSGYGAWGGPPMQGDITGLVVPCAAGGSLVFAPRICLDDLKTMKNRFGDRCYQKYGFVDAFDPSKSWFNPDVIGIDVGPTVLMAENLRTGLIWKTFMKNPVASAGMAAANFRPIDQTPPLSPTTSLFTDSH